MKKRWSILIGVLLILLGFFSWAFFPAFTGEVTADGIPQFREVHTGFSHHIEGKTFPFIGTAVIDINGDGQYELFVGGGQGQDDALLSYQNGTFVDIIKGTGLSDPSATHGVVSLDVNSDGQTDLIVARHSGISMYVNNEGVFSREELSIPLEQDSVVLSVAPGDINNDGHVDLYLSTFIDPKRFRSLVFNDPEHGKSNVLLLNNGDNTFTDITGRSGTAIDQNTFLSAFVDLDHDNLLDLVVSTNTDTVHLFRNVNGTRFEEAPAPTGYGAWMGVDFADYDGDGDIDMFFSNMGRFVPKFFLFSDLKDDQILDPDWALIENQGDFSFENVNAQNNLQDREFAWGPVFTDLNLDGRTDLIVAENYVKWWAHHILKYPGRVYVQDDAGNFLSVTKQTGLANYHFGNAPLRWDFTGDGREDIIISNMDGPLRAFVNEGEENNFVKVVMPDALKSIGAKMRIEKQTGERLYHQWTTGTGFMTDQSPEVIFGLGSYEGPADLTIDWINGSSTFVQNIPANSVYHVG